MTTNTKYAYMRLPISSAARALLKRRAKKHFRTPSSEATAIITEVLTTEVVEESNAVDATPVRVIEDGEIQSRPVCTHRMHRNDKHCPFPAPDLAALEGEAD